MLARVIVYGLARNIKYYFIFKSKLRQARQEYQRTGVKTVLDIPGYTSLNTLMLATVINLFGLFALGASIYYAFIGFPDIPSMDDTLAELSLEDFQKIYAQQGQ
jgi:hypothetical protein